MIDAISNAELTTETATIGYVPRQARPFVGRDDRFLEVTVIGSKSFKSIPRLQLIAFRPLSSIITHCAGGGVLTRIVCFSK